MTKKQIFELLLKTAGFEMKNYELIRDGSSMVGYEFEAYIGDNCEFQVASDSFEGAIAETLEGIYGTADVQFTTIHST